MLNYVPFTQCSAPSQEESFVLDSSTALIVKQRQDAGAAGRSPLTGGASQGAAQPPLVVSPVRVCPSCSCCVEGLCRPGPSSGCPDAVDSRWPYPCPCTSNTMDAPLP